MAGAFDAAPACRRPAGLTSSTRRSRSEASAPGGYSKRRSRSPVAGGGDSKASGPDDFPGTTSMGFEKPERLPPAARASASAGPAGKGTSSPASDRARSRRPVSSDRTSTGAVLGGRRTRAPGTSVRVIALARVDRRAGRTMSTSFAPSARPSASTRSAWRPAGAVKRSPASEHETVVALSSRTRQTRQGTERRGSPAAHEKTTDSPSGGGSVAAVAARTTLASAMSIAVKLNRGGLAAGSARGRVARAAERLQAKFTRASCLLDARLLQLRDQ
jgi:hypothetical protein